MNSQQPAPQAHQGRPANVSKDVAAAAAAASPQGQQQQQGGTVGPVGALTARMQAHPLGADPEASG